MRHALRPCLLPASNFPPQHRHTPPFFPCVRTWCMAPRRGTGTGGRRGLRRRARAKRGSPPPARLGHKSHVTGASSSSATWLHPEAFGSARWATLLFVACQPLPRVLRAYFSTRLFSAIIVPPSAVVAIALPCRCRHRHGSNVRGGSLLRFDWSFGSETQFVRPCTPQRRVAQTRSDCGAITSNFHLLLIVVASEHIDGY